MTSEALVPLGVLVIVIGIILLVLGSLGGKSDVKVGIGGFIGPFIFGSSNDLHLLKLILIVSATVAIGYIILVLNGLR